VKDHVTLKTGVMMINSGINYTLLDIHIKKHMIYIIIIFQFLLYFTVYKCSLGEK